MIDLDQAIQSAKEQSKAIVESGEEHQPIMLALTPQGINPMLLRGIDKDRFKEVIGGLLRQLHAYAYIFINEAWAADLDKDSPLVQELLSGRKKISELPPDDRIESLMIMAAENGKSYRLWSAKILYTRDGDRYLGEWEEKKGEGPTGRLILREW